MKTITIAMAIYKPKIDWLIEELDSIYHQTYRDFQVLVWDDCPEDTNDYNELFKGHLKEIPFTIHKGKKNLGSNGAFQNLTELTETPFIAYCDQDDIWMPDKLQVLLGLLQADKHNTLAFSDMMVIDGKSKLVANRIAQVRPRQVFYLGETIAGYFNVDNIGIHAEREGGKLKELISPILKCLPQSIKLSLRKIELASGVHKVHKEYKERKIYWDNSDVCLQVLKNKKNILVVDDSVDTGYSMISVLHEIRREVGKNVIIKTAAINCWSKSFSIIKTDYFCYADTIRRLCQRTLKNIQNLSRYTIIER